MKKLHHGAEILGAAIETTAQAVVVPRLLALRDPCMPGIHKFDAVVLPADWNAVYEADDPHVIGGRLPEGFPQQDVLGKNFHNT